jgi:hypothetical protein
MLQRIIGENIAVRISVDSSACTVRADAGQIDQVLLNLAVNSRDAMPDGGTFSIMTANVVLDEKAVKGLANIDKPGQYVKLTVSDTGCGMDAKTQRSIFDPFFTTKTEGKGTGLGLATVFGIIQQHGGDITVMSEPGMGTAFTIYLPKEDQVPNQVPAAVASDSLRGTETVLVVEDEEVVLALISRALNSSGYRVIEARNPREAIEAAAGAKGQIHLLLTDMTMPEMNGRQLAGEIKAVRPDIAVLYISGYAARSAGPEEMQQDQAFFLQKPFTVEGLARKVRQVLG